MTSKRRKVWVGLGVIVLLVVALPFLWPVDEPKYNGRYLSEWHEMYDKSAQFSPERLAAQEAIRSIGTNALPYYLNWISYEPPEWRMALRRNPPKWMWGYRTMYKLLVDKAELRTSYANTGIGILGANAVSALPTLEALLKDPSKPRRSYNVLQMLAYLGEPSIPIFKSALADTNRTDRELIPNAIFVATYGDRTNLFLPILIEATRDGDRSVRESATSALGLIAPEVLTNAPSGPMTE